MKKLILALIATAGVAAGASAQSHSWLLYGSASYDNTSVNGSGLSNTSLGKSWSVLPGFGYQINEHVTLGAQGGYSKSPYYPYYTGGNNDITNWSVGIFGRYTHWIGKIFFVYGQVNMSYAAVKSNIDNLVYLNTLYPPTADNVITDGNGLQANVFPGVGINVWKGFALNMSFGGIGYTYISATDGSLNSNHVNLNFGQELNIGVSKNFGGYHKHHRHHGMEPGMELRHIDISVDDDDDAPPPPMHHKKKQAAGDDE